MEVAQDVAKILVETPQEQEAEEEKKDVDSDADDEDVQKLSGEKEEEEKVETIEVSETPVAVKSTQVQGSAEITDNVEEEKQEE